MQSTKVLKPVSQQRMSNILVCKKAAYRLNLDSFLIPPEEIMSHEADTSDIYLSNEYRSTTMANIIIIVATRAHS